MVTRVITLTGKNREKAAKEAAEIIRNGGLVAFPTETVYGLGADALRKPPAEKIYEAKGRPSDNPLIVHIADTSDLTLVAKSIPDSAYTLAKRFWPGPLTMILKKADSLPKETTGGLDTVAVRLPSDETARAVIREAGTPIAAPSANTSGRPSPTAARHVLSDLEGRVDLVIDGGTADIGIESTIIDLTVRPHAVLRPGFITVEELSDVLNEEVLHPANEESSYGEQDEITEGLHPRAPGMKYRHYAPKGFLTVVSGSPDKRLSYIRTALKEASDMGKRTAVLAPSFREGMYEADLIESAGKGTDAEEYAHILYTALRKMDDKKIDVIYAEALPENGVGEAVMNRLVKAAGGHVIHLR